MKNGKIFVILLTLVAAGSLWTGTWSLSTNLAGKKPDTAFKAPAAPDPFAAELLKLKTEVEATPDDVVLLRKYAALLETAAGHSGKLEFVIELEQTYRSIIRLQPEDALREKERLADIRFGMKDFEQAADLYHQILAQQNDNQLIRGRLASTLTFLGQFDAAIAELNTLLAADPNSFQGHAYLSITYAQMGEKDRAYEIGSAAMKLAPNDEARKRFQGFLETLRLPTPPEESSETKEDQDSSNVSDQGPETLLNYLKGNEITSKKFVGSSLNGTELTLRFQDFPMEVMPPFAREKFFGNLKSNVANSSIQKIRIIDNASGKELAALDVNR